MKTLYFIIAGLVVTGGMAVSVYFGIQPKSVPKINLSHFEKPERFAQAISQRLYLELKSQPLVLLGVTPGRSEQIELWAAFLEGLKGSEQAYDLILIEPGLPGIEAFPQATPISLRDQTQAWAQGVRQALEQGLRVAMIAPSFFVSQLIRDNPVSRLKAEFQLEPLSFSTSPFPFNREDEAKSDVRCDTGEADRSGTAALNCAVLHKSRVLYRKKKDPTKFIGTLDQVGMKDYLVLFATPRSLAENPVGKSVEGSQGDVEKPHSEKEH